MVDEAFADFEAETLCVDPPPKTVVLRSFGKTYGLAGLRLGFAVARADIAERLRAALGSWAVSGPALEIGGRALADVDWLARTRARLEADARWLDGLLARAGFETIGGTLLFRLAARVDAVEAFDSALSPGRADATLYGAAGLAALRIAGAGGRALELRRRFRLLRQARLRRAATFASGNPVHRFRSKQQEQTMPRSRFGRKGQQEDERSHDPLPHRSPLPSFDA